MTIKHVEDYLKSVKEQIKSLELPAEKQYTNYFRGQSNAHWDLVPSVFRDHLFNEHNLYHEMERNLYNEMSKLSSVIDKLVYMQHQGLPTRLLDITKNSLVALYFACITHQKCEKECTDKKDCKKCSDGAVYIFSELENYDKKEVDIISLLPKVKYDFGVNSFYSFVKEQLGIELSKKELERILNKEFALVKSNKNNNRVIKQDGDFFIFSNKGSYDKKIKFDVKRDENRIIIPKEYKKQLLEELDQIGINRYSLFPEPEHLAKYLKHNYVDNESEKEKVVSYEEVSVEIEEKKDYKTKVLEYIEENFPQNKALYEFIVNNDISRTKAREKLSLLGYEEIGVLDMDKFDKFIDSLEIPKNINDLVL
ncbi:hypothetical protein CRV01_08435 [Arcobacter sp. CECT 8983]|uniref:FRG domain-containing protein n=1 Tax=Arcobacter sp. CECT 8983 TaxID=2044508 RepID=UPI00100A3C00|nr:FRG domain-containing protein [Arcobacter sp. CECT 8983]RXJ89494.1 hypothetical protein CRV01_08435 [Arcobacter sp. CECT 8983]